MDEPQRRSLDNGVSSDYGNELTGQRNAHKKKIIVAFCIFTASEKRRAFIIKCVGDKITRYFLLIRPSRKGT
jgi:hypothetical protein